MIIKHEETEYGFNQGTLSVERICSDSRKGCTVIMLKTERNEVQVYVTKSGKIRLFGKDNKEYRIDHGN